MLKKTKTVIVALVCMGMFLDLSVLSRAAENRVCEGGCEMELIEKRVRRYSPINESTHKIIWEWKFECVSCHTIRTEQREELECCGWTEYTDLGHQTAQYHRYRIACGKCGRSQEITLTTCEAEWTGRHVTPW